MTYNSTRDRSSQRSSAKSKTAARGPRQADRGQASRSTGFQHKDGTGSLFFDAPGVPTMSGALRYHNTYDVTLEPAIDRNQNDYQQINGDGVSGALYANDRKQEDRHPDLTGPIEIGGHKLRVSGWFKEIKSGQHAGDQFLSLAISEPYHGGK